MGALTRHLSVSAVIPALDEERSIGAVLDAIPRDIVGEVVVVDGGSSDATAAVASARGARVVSEPLRGYGRACARGVSEAHSEIVVFLDADGACDPEDIRALAAPVAEDRADLVLGSRLRRGGSASMIPGAMPFQQRFGNRLAAFLIRVLYGLPISDLGPFRAVRRDLLRGLPLEDLTFGWPTEMIVKAALARWRITEVPVSCRPRTGGRSKISGTIGGATLAAWHIFRTIAGSARLGPHAKAVAPVRGAPGGARSIVVVMAKQPVPGRTKTRLCPLLTPVEAAELYEAMLRDTIALVSGLRGIEMAIAVSPRIAAGQMTRLVPRGTRVLAVEGADIGECLSSATEQLLAEGFTRVVALNSDGPTLPAEYLERAVEALAHSDVVLGPAEDGGYYLIGIREKQPGLFADIAWSSSRVAAQTMGRSAALGLAVVQLPSWYDVDTPAEFERLRAELAASPAAISPRTRAFLARH